MTPDELKQMCGKAINHYGILKMSGKAKVTLTMPESKSAPKRRRLFGKSGPFGEVVLWGFDNRDTVIFDAQEALDYLSKEGEK